MMVKIRAWCRQIGLVIVALLGLAYSFHVGQQSSQHEQPMSNDSLNVLFIGNSFTYRNDMPAIVEALAKATGQRRFVYKIIASGGVSLIEHWEQGAARKTIAQGGWDVVVLQQGPSALPESRSVLIAYARKFAEEIRQAGAKPALYMVWPGTDRFNDYDRVSESYRLAAEEIDGMLFPAGEAWRAGWRRDSKAAFYSRDGLHPSILGSYLTALVIYEQLYGTLPASLPRKLNVASRSVGNIELQPKQLELLLAAAHEANQQFGRR
jgi:hypothetical protein